MKKNRVITTIVLAAMFLGGLSALLYPMVSDYINLQSQTRVIEQFFLDIAEMTPEDHSAFFERAHEYNQRLLRNPSRFTPSERELREYHNLFDFTGRGVIGVLEIEAINIKIPLYLGTEERVLQLGIGHLVGSSFPIGGPGTHSAVSGHRGLPSSILLTNADRLVEGDIFSLTILNEVLYYEIDDIVIVYPTDMERLSIDPEKDYCTVFTCTPYGINSHRLLLRGFRIFPEIGDITVRNSRVLRADAQRAHSVAEYVIAALPILFIILIYKLIKSIKSKIKK